jgi:hypothetical protein
MKNIQVIDGAINSVYDIFIATDEEFLLIFPKEQDIAFIDEVYDKGANKANSGYSQYHWIYPRFISGENIKYPQHNS